MIKNKMSRYFMLSAVILSVGLGCKFIKASKTNDIEETKAQTKTLISKIVLKERLTVKGVKMASAKNTQLILKPNPFTLHLKFATGNNNFQLNGENYDNFGELANKLNEIFKSREENGVFKEGTNEIYKIITLPAPKKFIDEYNSKEIYVEDFENLVDDLQKEGFDQIELDTNEENFADSSIEPPPTLNRANEKTGTNSKNIKTISGGVLNGKAKNLVQPTYPAAARAVKASGAVNVQVTIDENGDVISASAVSGHPLLRASAVQAAKASTFSPTLLGGESVRVTGVIVYNFKPE